VEESNVTVSQVLASILAEAKGALYAMKEEYKNLTRQERCSIQ
jgi:hypothetical protein